MSYYDTTETANFKSVHNNTAATESIKAVAYSVAPDVDKFFVLFCFVFFLFFFKQSYKTVRYFWFEIKLQGPVPVWLVYL